MMEMVWKNVLHYCSIVSIVRWASFSALTLLVGSSDLQKHCLRNGPKCVEWNVKPYWVSQPTRTAQSRVITTNVNSCRPNAFTVCFSDITSTRITRWRTTRSVPGDSYQPAEPCISSVMGICPCGRPSPLGRVSTRIGKTGLSCQQYCHLCQYLWWRRLPTLWADHQ